MNLEGLFNDVKDAITRHNDPAQTQYPQGNLINFVQDLFGKHSGGSFGGGDRSVRPASEDPYGDPGAGGGFNARPASQDPYGDPADR